MNSTTNAQAPPALVPARRFAQLRNRSMIRLSLLMVTVTISTCALAQNSSEFSILQKHINREVTVDTPDGQVTGRLLRVEESRLVVYEAGTPKPIARESVKRVTKHKSRHSVAWVAGTSAAGLGAGFLIGLSAFNDATYANSKIATTALVGAGAGAAAGFGFSRIGKRDEVIYRSE
jgi:hypothetical protein